MRHNLAGGVRVTVRTLPLSCAGADRVRTLHLSCAGGPDMLSYVDGPAPTKRGGVMVMVAGGPDMLAYVDGPAPTQKPDKASRRRRWLPLALN